MEKQYYYYDGQKQVGPVSFDQLKSFVKNDTLVWHAELPEWTKASLLPELSELLKKIPPPLPFVENGTIGNDNPAQEHIKKNSGNANRKRMKNFIWISIGIIVLGCIITLGIFILPEINNDNYRNRSDSNDIENVEFEESPPREKTPEELRQELYDKEKRNPLSYLSVSYSLDYKVFSGEDVIKGYIYNTATMASFKDVVLKVTYKSGTGTTLSTEDFVVYQYVYPSNSASFKIKTYSPSNTKQINVEVKSAKAE